MRNARSSLPDRKGRIRPPISHSAMTPLGRSRRRLDKRRSRVAAPPHLSVEPLPSRAAKGRSSAQRYSQFGELAAGRRRPRSRARLSPRPPVRSPRHPRTAGGGRVTLTAVAGRPGCGSAGRSTAAPSARSPRPRSVSRSRTSGRVAAADVERGQGGDLLVTHPDAEPAADGSPVVPVRPAAVVAGPARGVRGAELPQRHAQEHRQVRPDVGLEADHLAVVEDHPGRRRPGHGRGHRRAAGG
jgi:hypothetical protein